ncbi:hypothetical protein HBI24_028490 [Parastagonospora nodorum]|nr:hypothetical protein HBH51_152960 [Parastagonospora nodorum]KAH5072127.1 hypothetical protein HBH95_168510 [Parastagonospora nodorum]KAH5123886.1 hypothetical protein HBH71_030180 [Parastagonospora nodorum]KAH5197752.1 hypothetical protein HBH76_029110 [Parastagonospora nodorum]KAH5469455.1 hypothetical protein HBI28_174260 [Parastagonospora nodorum]
MLVTSTGAAFRSSFCRSFTKAQYQQQVPVDHETRLLAMDRSKTRKPHKKSRNGCLPCKGRHVKCDEQRPNCANCVKQGTPCEYKSPKSREPLTGSPMPIASLTPTSTDAIVPEKNTVPDGGSPDITNLNIAQLRLLHHYTTVTAKTLAHDSAAEVVFSTHLVKTAFSYPFLLHAILALGALHLSRLEGPSSSSHTEYVSLADQHHDAALNDFRTRVLNIDDTNWEAVLMFAGALFPYSCTASVTASDDLDLAFGNFLSNLVLTRRVRPMVTGFYQEMMKSELGAMIPSDVEGINWETKEVPVETELVQLRKFAEVVHHIYPPDIIDAYGYAIHILELTFVVAAESARPPSDALLKIWIHFVSDRYVELLSERQPGSLIILAHYAVLLHRSRQYWYLDGEAEQILNIANAFVPTEWQSWLEWPKAQIRGGPVTPMS